MSSSLRRSTAGRTVSPGWNQVLERALRERGARADQRRDIWGMSAAERVAAFWAGDLTFGECLEWARRAHDEVPKAPDGEFLFTACRTPEWLGD